MCGRRDNRRNRDQTRRRGRHDGEKQRKRWGRKVDCCHVSLAMEGGSCIPQAVMDRFCRNPLTSTSVGCSFDEGLWFEFDETKLLSKDGFLNWVTVIINDSFIMSIHE